MALGREYIEVLGRGQAMRNVCTTIFFNRLTCKSWKIEAIKIRLQAPVGSDSPLVIYLTAFITKDGTRMIILVVGSPPFQVYNTEWMCLSKSALYGSQLNRSVDLEGKNNCHRLRNILKMYFVYWIYMLAEWSHTSQALHSGNMEPLKIVSLQKTALPGTHGPWDGHCDGPLR